MFTRVKSGSSVLGPIVSEGLYSPYLEGEEGQLTARGGSQIAWVLSGPRTLATLC